MSSGRYIAILLRTQCGEIGHSGFAHIAYGRADVRDVTFRTLATQYDLEDWIGGHFPAEYRDVKHAGHLKGVLAKHIRWSKQDKRNPRMPRSIQRRDEAGQWHIAKRAPVPASYEGLRFSDVCAVLVTNPLDVVLGNIVSEAASLSVPLIVVREIRRTDLHVDPSNFGSYADLYRLWAHCVMVAQQGGYGDGI
ncbi:hypothetical protein HY622_03065 [Candidatus Uhrbacteria bacterium]|nr:hypothetical protein [Candidatus Uhrbacteria bacterium]